jgi:lipooligosaccharide transport system permease protein
VNCVTTETVSLLHPVLRWYPVWQRNFRVWRKMAGPSLLGNFGEPLLYLLALGYGLGSFIETIDGLPYVVYLASGVICSSAMFSASFEGMYSAYSRMVPQRTWDAMLATPLAVTDVVIGEAVWAASKGLINSVAILIVATLLGVIDSWQVLWVLPVIALMGLCFAALALIMTAFSRSYDFFLYYNTLVLIPMLMLGGVFFPLERLPAAIQWLAQLSPLTHTIALVRPLATGGTIDQPLLHLLVLSGYVATALWLAVTLLRRRLLA